MKLDPVDSVARTHNSELSMQFSSEGSETVQVIIEFTTLYAYYAAGIEHSLAEEVMYFIAYLYCTY